MMENGRHPSADSNRVEYDPGKGAYCTRYDWNGENSLPVVIVSAVSAITENERSFDVLYDRIDPDALERLFEPTADTQRHAYGKVTFSFLNHRIVVFSDGGIEIYPPGDGGDTDVSRESGAAIL